MSESDTHDDTTAEQDWKQARAGGVVRMLSGEAPLKEPNEPEPPDEVGGASNVGENITRRGEDVAKDKEPGRQDAGVDATPAHRPHGTSTARERTGVNPQEPIEDSPDD